MKITTSIIISAVTLLVGYFFDQTYLWLPLTVLIAGIVEGRTRQWVASNRLGSSTTISVLLKFVFAVIGFYAMIGQVACIGLIIIWFF